MGGRVTISQHELVPITRMVTSRSVGLAIIGGMAMTLLTGFVPFRSLLGAVHYGWPIPWLLRRIVAPEYFPWSVNWGGLALDLVGWTLVAFVLLALYDRFTASRPSARPAE
jgi:hypothetical protein